MRKTKKQKKFVKIKHLALLPQNEEKTEEYRIKTSKKTPISQKTTKNSRKN